MHEIYKLAKKDPRVVFVGSDIGAGTLDEFKKEMPDRFLMEGISEAHLIGMMTGMALSGKILYMNTIATFITRRCFEQVLLDAGFHRARIRLVGSGGGSVYAALGHTHLALEDIALMRAVPGMTIVAPCDAEEMKRLMPQTLDAPGPMYIRLAKGGDPVVSRDAYPFHIGQAIRMAEGQDALVISTGVTTRLALEAADELKKEGVGVQVLHMHTLKPLDEETLIKAVEPVRAVVTIEEHSVVGGLGAAVAGVFASKAKHDGKRYFAIAYPDEFIHHYGSQNFHMEQAGVTTKRLIETIRELLKTNG